MRHFFGFAIVIPLVACGGQVQRGEASVPSQGSSAIKDPSPASPMTTVTAKPNIVQIGDPVLRARAKDVSKEEIATPEFQALVARMIDAMKRAPGVGLAAPQIGVSKRVFVMEDPEEFVSNLSQVERTERERVAVPLRVFVNPVLKPVGNDRATFFEGCLSVSGFVGLVERAREVDITGLDEHGAETTWRVRGWPARILQHETDHLDGTIYVDRMITRSFATADQAKLHYAGKPIAEIQEKLGLPRR